MSGREQKRGQAAATQNASSQPRLREFLLGVALLIGCVATGIQIAVQAREARDIAADLHDTRLASQSISAERSRLLIQRGALAAYQNIDQVAENTLDMRVPERSRNVVLAERSGAPVHVVGEGR